MSKKESKAKDIHLSKSSTEVKAKSLAHQCMANCHIRKMRKNDR